MRIQLAAAALAVSFSALPAGPAATAAVTQPALRTLYSFCADAGCTDGADLWSGVVQGTDGAFYGTTFGGGNDTPYNGQDYGVGVVYRITRGGQYTVLHTFNATTEGAYPQAGLSVGANGYLYGATTQGGTGGGGCVFRISTSGEFTVVHAFGAGEGFEAYAPPVLHLGILYGTTTLGGSNGVGTVYKIAANGIYTTLHNFTAGEDGANPEGGLLLGPDGNFYGTTNVDGGEYGFNGGTVFRITPGGTLTTLHVFTYVDGADPEKTLALGSDGALYGTTTLDGPADGAGTIFRITTDGSSFSTLYSFPGPTVQYGPTSGLTPGADGNFYGVQAQGGTYSQGQIFSITTGGTFTAVQSIGATKIAGKYPEASLALGSDGKLYGTTLDGGQNGDGTVFVFDPAAASD